MGLYDDEGSTNENGEPEGLKMGEREDEIDRDWQRDRAEDELVRLRAIESAARELVESVYEQEYGGAYNLDEVALHQLRLALRSDKGEG